jgi:hypothetical protein
MTFQHARASPFSEITDDSSFEYNHCQGYFQGYNQGRGASYSFNPGNENMQRQGSTMTNGYQYPSTEQHPAYWRPLCYYSAERPQHNKTRWPQPYPTNHRTSWANYEYFGYARAGESPSMASSEETLPTSNMTTSYLHSHYKYGDYFVSARPSSSSCYPQAQAEDTQRREAETLSPPPMPPVLSNTEGNHLHYGYKGNAYVTDEPEIPEPKHHSKEITVPGQLVGALQPLDITCGRGAPTNFHYGNQVFRELVEGYQTAYLCAKRSDKPDIAMKLLDIVKERGGRFVRRRKAGGHSFSWETIGDMGAYEKVCQRLRDGAPDLRRQMLSTSSIKDQNNKEDGQNARKRNGRGENKEHTKENSHRKQVLARGSKTLDY